MSYYKGPPPPGQHYQQPHSPYPPQGGHPPPPNQPYGQQGYNQYNQPPPGPGYGSQPPPPGPYGQPQGQYGAPQGGYGPPPGQYGQPPPGQYGGPPPGHYGGPPPGHPNAPPQGQYGGPQGQYGAPPQGQYGAPPPGQYSAPPQGQWGAPSGPPAPPSIGYVPGQHPPHDMGSAADGLRAAMKGFGTNEKALIQILAPLGPLEINGVKQAFHARHRRDLIKDIQSETSNNFRCALLAICRGPLEQDCYTVHEAIKGAGTNEHALNEVLLARSNADLNAIKQHYRQMYGKSLEQDVRDDLSMKTKRLFEMVTSAQRAEESAPIIPQQIDADITEIYKATESRMGADQLTVCSIFSSRSNAQLRAISQGYMNKYRRPLNDVVVKEFSGHMEDALLHMLGVAEDQARHDAEMLEAAMRGAGTKDKMLIRRVVMIHWDRHRLHQARGAYRHIYNQDLRQRIAGETSGDHGKLLEAVVSV